MPGQGVSHTVHKDIHLWEYIQGRIVAGTQAHHLGPMLGKRVSCSVQSICVDIQGRIVAGTQAHRLGPVPGSVSAAQLTSTSTIYVLVLRFLLAPPSPPSVGSASWVSSEPTRSKLTMAPQMAVSGVGSAGAEASLCLLLVSLVSAGQGGAFWGGAAQKWA